MAKRINDLSEETSKDLERYLESDKETTTESKKYSLETVLRTRVGLTANSSASSYTLNYDGIEQINLALSASGTVNLSIVNVPADAVMFLNISKPAATIVDITQGMAPCNIERGAMAGFTGLKYMITTQNGVASVKRLDSYYYSTLATGNLIATYGCAKTSFYHIRMHVNGNLCNIHMQFGVTPTGPHENEFIFDITDFPYTLANTLEVLPVLDEYATVKIVGNAKLYAGHLKIELSSDAPGGENTIYISGTFIIT